MAVKYVTRRAEDKKWCVKNAKAEKATRVFSTQKEAIEYAQSLKSTTSIMVQSREGKFRKVSKWDGIKKAPATAAKKVASGTKKVAKATVAAPKKAVSKVAPKKAAAKPAPKKDTTKEEAIKELKAQNAQLDKQIADEKSKEAERAKKAEKMDAYVADKEAKEEAKQQEKEIKKENKPAKSNGKKAALAFGVIFLLAVITVGVLFTLDWQEVIHFMDVIKK